MRKITQHPFLKAELLTSIGRKKRINIPSVIDTGIVYGTINARSALDLGIRCLRLQPGDEVLIPAYHCPVMVYPVVKAGGRPVFYQINSDCSTNIDDLKRKITRHTKAVIVVHYFGFPSRVSDIRSICTQKNI